MSEQDEMVTVGTLVLREAIGGLSLKSHFHGSGTFPAFCCDFRRDEVTEAILASLPTASTSVEAAAERAARAYVARSPGHICGLCEAAAADDAAFAALGMTETAFRARFAEQVKEARRLLTPPAPLGAEGVAE